MVAVAGAAAGAAAAESGCCVVRGVGRKRFVQTVAVIFAQRVTGVAQKGYREGYGNIAGIFLLGKNSGGRRKIICLII
jgi:hypothetical protein